jgi:hypothetical protein
MTPGSVLGCLLVLRAGLAHHCKVSEPSSLCRHPRPPICKELVEHLRPRHVETGSLEQISQRELPSTWMSRISWCAEDLSMCIGDAPFIIHAHIVHTALTGYTLVAHSVTSSSADLKTTQITSPSPSVTQPIPHGQSPSPPEHAREPKWDSFLPSPTKSSQSHPAWKHLNAVCHLFLPSPVRLTTCRGLHR